MTGPPLTLEDIYERTRRGLLRNEREFDSRILPGRARELVKEHEIKFDASNIIPNEGSLADDVWEAGVRLFLDVGVYCRDTESVIKITEEELKASLREQPGHITIGEGRDSRVMVARAVEDAKPALTCCSPTGTPFSEDIAVRAMQAYIQECTPDMFGSPSITSVDGQEVVAGSPNEILAVKREALWAREAARRAGKPGIHIQGATTAVTAAAAGGAYFPEGLRKTDTIAICMLAELKLDYRVLCKAAFAIDLGGPIYTCPCPVMGGIAGGPETTAVVTVAEALESIVCIPSRATYIADSVVDMKYAASSRPESMWIHNISAMAISRNSRILYGDAFYIKAGPCTDMALYETAAVTIGNNACGRALSYGVATCCGVREDYTSPMEARLLSEVNRQSAGMKTTNANLLVGDLIKRYAPRFENAPSGKSFRDCYDLKTLKPIQEHEQLYKRVRKEIEDLGLPSD